eukprot:4275744-Karenia_brevis.AAC.1
MQAMGLVVNTPEPVQPMQVDLDSAATLPPTLSQTRAQNLKALETMQETLEEWKLKLGPDHPQTLNLQKDVEKFQKQNSDIHQLKDKQ